jgi:hypothetical protein
MSAIGAGPLSLSLSVASSTSSVDYIHLKRFIVTHGNGNGRGFPANLQAATVKPHGFATPVARGALARSCFSATRCQSRSHGLQCAAIARTADGNQNVSCHSLHRLNTSMIKEISCSHGFGSILQVPHHTNGTPTIAFEQQ